MLDKSLMDKKEIKLDFEAQIREMRDALKKCEEKLSREILQKEEAERNCHHLRYQLEEATRRFAVLESQEEHHWYRSQATLPNLLPHGLMISLYGYHLKFLVDVGNTQMILSTSLDYLKSELAVYTAQCKALIDQNSVTISELKEHKSRTGNVSNSSCLRESECRLEVVRMK
ncbi:hypothetical protein KIW84_035007 [Lathyrus oleraceus]|uniref:Uncharacterized protein n=1 Tax=Pisum sativum TaxID=3888 RepID=A0A9D5B1U7_PEA|nr:hypothetical protein KIW84_035007 [Pisum sativum]